MGIEDDDVRAKLEKAQSAGSMTYEELNELLPPEEVSSEDVEDTLKMLSDMGIELTDGRTEEERDQAFYDSIQSWVAEGNMMPQLTGEGWASICRVHAREEAAWRAKLGVPQGLDIPEPPIPDDDEELLDEYTLYRDEMTALLKIRTSPDCPDAQEGAELDSRYIYVMNRTFKLQCELRDRLRTKMRRAPRRSRKS